VPAAPAGFGLYLHPLVLMALASVACAHVASVMGLVVE
jgi:hypothetical protein